MHRPVALAFDVGGTAVKAAAVAGRDVLIQTSAPSRPGPAILDVIMETAQTLLDALTPEERSRVSAAGAAMPGLVDSARGVCVRSVNLDLTDLDVAGPLTSRLGVPVRVGHDVLVAGTAVRRSVEAPDPFVVVLGTGIASVTYVGGAVVRGTSGQAGELGHVIVRPGGPVCRCGARGCLEAVAGAGAMVRAYTARTGRPIDGTEELLARRTADPVAGAIWDEAVSALADALVTVSALLAPGAIVLAGGVSEAGEDLRGPVRDLMLERSRVTPVPPVLVSDLRGRAGLIGAADLAQEPA